MIQVDENKINIDCACDYPYHRLRAEYEPDDETLWLVVMVVANSFWGRIKLAYKVLTSGECFTSEIVLDKRGIIVLRQFVESLKPKTFSVVGSGTTDYMKYGK